MKFKSIITFLIYSILLISCGDVTPLSQSTPTETANILPKETDITSSFSSTTGITPENGSSSQIINKWGEGNIYGVALSPDGKNIAISTAKGIYIYEYDTLQVKEFIDLPYTLNANQRFEPRKAISFSSDGNLLALGYNDIIIWNLVEGKIDRRINNQIPNHNIVQVAFSPNNASIVAMSMGHYAPCDAVGGNFALYSATSGTLIYNDYFCPESTLFHFSFLNNYYIAFAGMFADSNDWIYTVKTVDSTTGSLIKRSSYNGIVISISQDGLQISTLEFPSYSTKIIDANTQSIINTFEGAAIFLPDHQNLLVNSQNGWAATTKDNKTICKFENSSYIALSNYGTTYTLTLDKLIFWDDISRNLEIWDTSNCQVLKKLYISIEDKIFK